VDGLDELNMPFLEKEIDEVVMAMPSGRALGPDGFHGYFL
jgi:hypothetical protein